MSRSRPVACAPGFTVETSPLGSVLRQGNATVGRYSAGGWSQLDLDVDGLSDLGPPAPVPQDRQPYSFVGCSDEDAATITNAYFEVLGSGMQCLSDGSPRLAGDFAHVIKSAVIVFECVEHIPDACADVRSDVPTPGPALCFDGTTPYRIRINMSAHRSGRCGGKGWPGDLASSLFHEIFHTFVATQRTHRTDTPDVDRVKACERWCFPTPNAPRIDDDGRCCFEPGATCERQALGKVTWQRITSHVRPSINHPQCGPDLPEAVRDYFNDGCHWTFTSEPGGQVFVETSCEFHRHTENWGEQAFTCPPSTGTTCDKGDHLGTVDYTSSCRSREPYTFASWPVIEQRWCETNNRQEVYVTDRTYGYCEGGARRRERSCVSKEPHPSTVWTTIDIERLGRTGVMRTPQLPCPAGDECSDYESVKWSFSAGFGPR